MANTLRTILLLLVAAAGLAATAAAPHNDSFLQGFNGPFPTVGGFAGTELTSTVSLLYQNDWDVDYVARGPDDWSSRCIDMVYRTAEFRGKTVNLMITHYWADVAGSKTVDYFCHKVKSGGGCPRINRLAIDRFRFGLQWCLAKAVEMGLDVAITPRLDDGLERGGWRNALVFDPLARYGGYSYYDIMLKPIASALSAVMAPDTQVWFAMGGEMSATVMRHPVSWTTAAARLKADIVAGRDDAELLLPHIKVGVSTNFNKLCACVLTQLVDANAYLALLPAAMKSVEAEFNKTAISHLYASVDFIGLSSYASLQPEFTLPDLEGAIRQFDIELAQFGPNLTDLIHRQGKALVLSEYGVGGGVSRNGSVPAATAAEAAALPFFGVFGQYSADRDPWRTSAPEAEHSEVRDWRRRFFKETSRWLMDGGRSGGRYRVDAVYLWALASWDVQAIHYASRSAEGSYRDLVIAALIREHNTYVHSPFRK